LDTGTVNPLLLFVTVELYLRRAVTPRVRDERSVGVPLGLESCPAMVVKRALSLLSAFALTA